MKLPIQELVKGCQDPKGMNQLLIQAESVIRTWQPAWSDFLSAPLREEALAKMRALSELQWHSEGGYEEAERQKVLCKRAEDTNSLTKEEIPIVGIRIEGNFLFDKANPQDFRTAITREGIEPGCIGDIWIRGDRGAEALCDIKTALKLNHSKGILRDVSIKFEAISIDDLHLPPKRLIKSFSTVEASCRLDAIASAGFGLSRAKIISHINEGILRLNWLPIKQASKELKVGDRLQLDQRGSIKVLSLELTKRQRWRIQLLRR